MKKTILTCILIPFTQVSFAGYLAKIIIDDDNLIFKSKENINWLHYDSTYTSWTNIGDLIDCTNWSPATSTVNIGVIFTQTATDCNQKQTRNRQDREQESATLEIRNKGETVQETQQIIVTSTRQSTGTKETWIPVNPTYTAWVNSGSITGCTNWTPDPSTVNVGQPFTQTATDCKQNQTRNRQDLEQETTTLEIRNKGDVVQETQPITVTSTRQSTGTNNNECRYDSKNQVFYYESENGYDSGKWTFLWDGKQLNSSKLITGWDSSLVKLDLNGYRYTVGANGDYYNSSWSSSSGSVYEFDYHICRTKL